MYTDETDPQAERAQATGPRHGGLRSAAEAGQGATYLIGEVGQNHNGSVELAKKLIDIASMPIIDDFANAELPRLDAVKFTKRDLDRELSAAEMNRPYDSPHSFGRTYGEHRRFLELEEEQHLELFRYAREQGLEFVETLCSPSTVGMLRLFQPDRLKVASRDMTNVPLLEALAETGIPIILSTGMSGREELDEALAIITRRHDRITILHCLSQYPADYNAINLRTLEYLKREYPNYTIGYSDHSIGIMIPAAAVAVGARVIEKHITLGRRMKGSDHYGSLEPEGLWRMVRDIRNLERAMGVDDFFVHEASQSAQKKLARSVATLRSLRAGDVVREEDLHLLSPGDGFRWSQRGRVVNRRLKVDVPVNEILYDHMLE